MPSWWWPLFLGCTTLLKGDAQDGAVKALISPVSLQTGGWTVSMGCVIVMRGVLRLKTVALTTQQSAQVSGTVISEQLTTLLLDTVKNILQV